MRVTILKNKPARRRGSVFVEMLDENKMRIVERRNGQHVLLVGVGKRRDVSRRKLQILIRKIALAARNNEYSHIVLSLADLRLPAILSLSDEALVSTLVENMELALFSFSRFKTKTVDKRIEELVVVGNPSPALTKAARQGQTVAREVNRCRELSNTPGGDMTPQLLAKAAKNAARGTPVSVRVLRKATLEKERMGAVLGVARGSSEEPQFIILEYWGAERRIAKRRAGLSLRSFRGERRPVVLIGKGVTFDTGGLNLKPTDGINDMHLDMSGGAAVLHAIILAAKLNLKKNVIGLIPAVENMPSGSSYRPGDILTSLSGKTIEVLNTDAEGRIILADAITYAKRYFPRLVVDVATLTGAALVALGQHAHAIMTKDVKLSEEISRLGEEVGEYVWPLPLWEEYEQYTVGTFGDVANVSTGAKPRYGDAIHGGTFLYQFAKEYPSGTRWVHIDMAPRMLAAAGDNLGKGATGEPVRLLTRIIEKIL